jgi:DNA modification methylase
MQPVYQSENAALYQGDNISTLAEIEPETIDCGLDSPPYFALCDYRHELQHGLEPTIEQYLEVQSKVRSLQLKTFKEGGVLAIVIDDTVNNYSAVRGKGQRKAAGEWVKRREPQAGYREKQLIQVSAKYVDMMQDLGWHLILERFWDKGTGGRRTAFGSSTVEHVLFFVKQSTGRRLNPVRFIPFNSSLLKCLPTSHPEHPCPFPVPLATEILKHICPPGGLVQDIYCGVGSSGLAALSIGAKYQGFDLNCRWAIDALQKEEARKVDQLQLFVI